MKRHTIASVTPTLSVLLGIEPPALSTAGCIDGMVDAMGKGGMGRVERCLIYAPDAVGTAVMEENPALLERLEGCAPHVAPLLSVFPPKTPVCFASMFTGALPESHGVRSYVKEILTCDTLFDALIRAGKRVAIATVAESSMEALFQGRRNDLFSQACDKAVTDCTLGLIEADRHELIVAYHQEYDDTLHEKDLRSPEALAALERHISVFTRLVDACHCDWSAHDRAVLFAPDHGAHLDPATGAGTHGEDIPEDMEVTHFFDLAPAAV